MSDNKLLPDVIDSASNAIQSIVPETAKETDGALSSVVGFFNNVVLYPVKKANLTFKYKLELFENDLKEKTKNIPKENLQIPPLMLTGPTLEALRYTYDEAELRNMYENLLASAMDNRISDTVHPAYVDAIKQMSPLDAKILSVIVNHRQLRCAEIIFQFKNSNTVYLDAMPKNFVQELFDLGDPFVVSSSLSNLNRLSLIDIKDAQLIGIDYNELLEHPYVHQREFIYKENEQPFEIKMNKHAITLNDYGKIFSDVCLRIDDEVK